MAIVFFNSLLVGVVWIAVFEVVHVDRQETINAAIERNNNLAIAFEEYAKRTIESADAVIQYMIREYVRSSGKIDLDQFVKDYAIDHKAFRGIVIADEHGNLAVTSYTGHPARPVNVADREHFRVHVKSDTHKLFVGKPVTGRVHGKVAIPFSRRINKPDGSFGGVAMVLIEPSRFTDVLQEANLHPLDVISISGLDGITRARLRGSIPSTGEDISKSPLFAEAARRPVGNLITTGQIDGIKRLFSYRTLPQYQLLAIVGTAEADVLAEFSRRQRQYFLAASVASILIAGFTLLLIIVLAKQRRAAANLIRSQASFFATFNQAAVGISHTDLDGRIFEVNQKLCEILGFTREELLNRNYADITHPDDIAANITFRRQLISRQDAVSNPKLEKRYIRKDGTIIWCLLTISVVYDDNGDIDYLAAIVQDVSELKAAEKTLGALEQERHLLAQQTEEERARLAEAQAVAKVGSWETKFPELTVRWSAETYRIFETDASRFQPTHAGFLEFIHPDDRATVNAAFLSSFASASENMIEHRIVMPDGRNKNVEERWRTICDAQGQPSRAIGTCQDITDKKEAERDRAQLAAIVESSNDAIFSRNLDGIIASWNQAAERMFGWTAAEVIGKPSQIISPPQYRGKFTHVLERVKRGETTTPFETKRIRKDGTLLDAQVSLSAIKDEDGHVIAIANIVRDITERKQTETERAQLAAIVESSNDAIFSRSLDGIIIAWNLAAERMFGWTAEEVIGKPVQIIIPPEYHNKIEPILERVKQGQAVDPIETKLMCKDGTLLDTQVTLSAVKGENGHVIAIASIVRNITERKRAEALLSDYSAQMRHLSWRLSEVEERERRDIHRELHDRVGANLAALKLDLNLINKLLATDDRQAASVRLQKAQQLTGETVMQIRDVMGNLRPPALDDYGLLAALRNFGQTYATRLGIPIMVDGDDIQPRLALAVETALFRIIQEALNNIAKHAQARRVGITITNTADRVTLIVTDDGIGFDTGHHVPRPDSWGLRTMRERALAIAADLRVESSPGNGTRIIVELARESA